MMLRAIDTHYKGRRFRSRLEARWVVFMDYLGIKWIYEPDPYALTSGPYLPDFYLPELYPTVKTNTAGAYLEVKPPGGEAKHSDAMERESGKPVLVSHGDPPSLVRGRFRYCDDCGRMYADGEKSGEGRWLCDEQGHVKGELRRIDMPLLINVAAVTALGYRFEPQRPGVRMTERGLMVDRLEPIPMTPAQLEAQRAAVLATMPEPDRIEAQREHALRNELRELQRQIASATDAELDALLRRKQDVACELDRLMCRK